MAHPETPPVGTKYLYEVSAAQLAGPTQLLQLPELLLDSSPEKYPKAMFRFFRELWEHNGYSFIKTPHCDVLALAARKSDEPPLLLVNSYRGMSDAKRHERQAYLKHYKEQTVFYATLTDEERREMQRAKLKRILEHVPDAGGVQGVQQYSLIIPRTHRMPHQYRLTGRGLHSVRTYPLGREAYDYNLPARPTPKNLSPYPDMRSLPSYSLFCDGEAFDTGRVNSDAGSYATHWRHLLENDVPHLLEGRVVSLSVPDGRE